MSMINIQNLTFAYDGSYDNVFENVSFCMDTDWKLGFTGRNGRGKTTFMRLLMGGLTYKGSISASVDFEYFPYDVQHPDWLVADVLEDICGAQEWCVRRELSLLGVDADDVLYRPFDTLSGGEQTKVLLAALFLKENNFLLIDEPTNHLDTAGRELLGRYLNGKKGYILVSHDQAFLDECVDHILSINRMNIEVQKGNYSTWEQNKQWQDQHELAENDKLKKDISRLRDAARQTADWSSRVESSKKGQRVAGLRPDRGHIGHMAAKMMKRSKATETRRQNAVEEKAKLLKNLESADELFMQPLTHHAHRLVTLEDVDICYGGRPVVRGKDLHICQGERVALLGANGSGKSSLLKLVAGQDVPHTGQVATASNLVISYVPQDTSFLRGGLHSFVEESGLDESLYLAILRKLDFPRAQFEKDMADLSGGQKKKVLLARSLCQKAHLYIWDEPLNFIDIISRAQIKQAILASGPTMLFVEHDIAFMRDIATRCVSAGEPTGHAYKRVQ